MGWPLRMFEPLEIYFVTVRCFQRRLLMRPSTETNEVLGGGAGSGAMPLQAAALYD